MKKRTAEQAMLLSQLQQIAQGLGETFAPFCEVVVHDLQDPAHSVLAIHNNLSGRQVGAPSTELGLARIADNSIPQVIANYANQFADGRQAKSTSVGIKDSTGQYVAALCLNVDLTLFHNFQHALSQFSRTDATAPRQESLAPINTEGLQAHIDQFAARLAKAPRSLKTEERRRLLAELHDRGLMNVRRSMETVALHLGVSRATVYNDAKGLQPPA